MNEEDSIITIEGIRFLAIDLTKPLSLDTEVYPGDPKLVKEVFSSIESGSEHYIFKIGDHNFQPHADAPKHQNPDLQVNGMEFFNIPKYIFNKDCLIDLSCVPESKTIEGIRFLIEIKKEHLVPYEQEIKKVGAVLIRTGYDLWLEENKKHVPENLPYLNEEAAEFLASFDNLKVIGTDFITIDAPETHFAHKKLTRSNLIVESMVNLHKIPIENRNSFTLQTKPVVIN